MNPKVTRTAGRLKLTVKKNLPTILTISSAAGAVTSTVLAARAAYKSVPTVEEHKDKMERLRANKDRFETEKEYNKETFNVYKKTAINLTKDYWPAAVSLGLTIAGIFTTNKVHRNRYFTMAGMYSAAAAAYENYRKRVKEKYGEEAEKELYYNTHREDVITIKTDKKGKEKTEVETVVKPGAVDDPNFSVYLIDQTDKSVWYSGRPDMTYYVLQRLESDLTIMLHTRGYLFLNEVLRALNKPEIPEGQVIGWVYDESKSEGDNRVDFGLKEGTENFDFFLSGKNDFVYLTMNHDGTIYDKFPLFDKLWNRNTPRRV